MTRVTIHFQSCSTLNSRKHLTSLILMVVVQYPLRDITQIKIFVTVRDLNPFPSQPDIMHISDIYHAYLRQISCIAQTDIMHISNRYHAYLKQISCISQLCVCYSKPYDGYFTQCGLIDNSPQNVSYISAKSKPVIIID